MRKLRIIYVQYTNPAGYPPLEHSSRILAGEGWRVFFLGTGDSMGGILRFPPHPNIEIRQIAFCPGGWRQKFHYLWFCLWVIGWILRWRPHWIYASEVLSCPIAYILSFVPSFKIIYHEHDTPNPTLRRPSFFMRMVLWLRRRLAHRVLICILPNEQRTRRFTLETGRKSDILCVWNCPAQEEISPPRSRQDRCSLRVLYHGSIGPQLLPLSVLEALSKLPEGVKLRTIGYETVGSKGYVQQLKQTAYRLGIEDRVEILGPLPRGDMLKQSQGFDIGLCLIPRFSEEINFQGMVGASNKPFDYLASGSALLISDLPDWKEMYVEPGYGLACRPEDPQSIADALRWFLEHPKETRAMGERGRQRILSEWNYERQFAPVLAYLQGDFLLR